MTSNNDSKRLQQLSSLSVNDLMSTNIIKVREAWTIKKLTDFFIEKGIAGAPVVNEDDALVGVVTTSDIIKFNGESVNIDELQSTIDEEQNFISADLSPEYLKELSLQANIVYSVKKIMIKDVVDISKEESLFSAAAVLLRHNIHRLFVTENSKVVGVITSMDLLRPIAKLA